MVQLWEKRLLIFLLSLLSMQASHWYIFGLYWIRMIDLKKHLICQLEFIKHNSVNLAWVWTESPFLQCP